MKKIISILCLISLFVSCKTNDDLNKITSIEPYFKGSNLNIDTTNLYKISDLSSQLEIKDSLFGEYNFIVAVGYHGHKLKLNKNNTFIEYLWGDCYEKPKYVKGIWYIKNDTLILKDRHKKQFKFIFYKYSRIIFLIPSLKVKEFNLQLEKNKIKLDHLIIEKEDTGLDIDRKLECFKYLCFFRILGN